MAGEETSAGAIFLEFKATLENIEKGFASVNQKLDTFANKAVESGEKIGIAGEKVEASLDTFSKSEAKRSAHIANFVGRLISLQFALQTLGTKGADNATDFGKGVEVLEKSLSSFAVIVSIMPNKLGLIVGAIAATISAISALTGPTKAEEERLNALAESIKKVDQAGKDIIKNRRDANIGEDIQQKIDKIVSPEKLGAKDPEGTLATRQRALDIEAKFLETLTQELLLQQRIGTDIGKINSLTGQVAEQEERLKTAAEGVARAKGPAKLQAELNAFSNTIAEVAKQSEITETFLENGLIDPAQQIQKEFELAQKRLEAFLSLSDEAKGKLTIAGDLFTQQLKDRSAEAATIKFLKDQEALDRERFEAARREQQQAAGDLAAGFSNAIGSGLVSGILQGKSAMETLAGIGENLFANMLNKVVDGFTKNLTSAFESIAGAGGEILGGLFTGLLGIGGALLSRGRGKGTSTFDSVKNAVTSTQEVRGIVAGPTTIPIAQISEDLGTAVAPVVEGIETSNGLLRMILNALSSGPVPAAGGGGRFVAAPTA